MNKNEPQRKNPARKRARNPVNNRTRTSQYGQILKYPEKGFAKVPSPVPIASSVAQTRFSFTATAPASGFLAVCLSPAFSTPCYLYQSMTSDTAWGAYTTQGTYSELNAYSVRRPVAAVMNVCCISNANTIAGAATISLANASFLANSYDTIRDINNATARPVINAFRQVWLPGDASDLNYTANTAINNANTQCVYFLASGLPSGLSFNIDIRVLMEYVPKSGYTDLVNPTIETPSSTNEVAKALYNARSSMFETIGNKAADYLFSTVAYAPQSTSTKKQYNM